jgi:hypothetical protein
MVVVVVGRTVVVVGSTVVVVGFTVVVGLTVVVSRGLTRGGGYKRRKTCRLAG